MYLSTRKKYGKLRLASALVAVVLTFGLTPLLAFAQTEGGDPGAALLAGQSDGPIEENNTAPMLAYGVVASVEATIEMGSTYSLDLTPLFTDPDGDPLTYTVEIDGAAAVEAEAAYSYAPSATGTKKLVFKAKDRTKSSASSYTVTLKVTAKQGTGDAGKAAADKKAAAAVSALIAKLPAASKATALDRTAANKAKEAYDALTDAQKAYVSKADVTKLNAVKEVADNEYENGLAKGKTFKVTTEQGKFSYKVTAKKKVTLIRASATKKNGFITVNEVDYHGVSYKVAVVGVKAFKSSKLKKVILGNNVTRIGSQAFSGSAFLTTFIIGKNVKKIGDSAFNKAAKLKALTVKSAKLGSKSKVLNALKGSSVKTVKLLGMTKGKKKKVISAFDAAGKKSLTFK